MEEAGVEGQDAVVTSTTQGGRGHTRIPRIIRRFNNTNYCFSYGYDIAKWYNGETYPWKKTNHDTDATRADDKGGSQKNKSLVE